MTRIAGNSAHEVRTWIAGYAALGAAGSYTVQQLLPAHPRAHRRLRAHHRHPRLTSGTAGNHDGGHTSR